MFARAVGSLVLALALMAPMAGGALQTPPNPPLGVLPADYQPWPREFSASGVSYRVYEPQAERWTGSDVKFRAAVAVTSDTGTRYGVVFGSARTWTDSASGLVKLESIHLDRANFPTGPDGGASYLSDLQRSITGTWFVRRDQLDPSRVVDERIPVRNDPPRIFVSYSPALLVLIDGQPALRKVPNSQYERVINTRSLLLRDPDGGRYYLHVFDGWVTARDLTGPWQIASSDSRLEQVKDQIAATGQIDLLDGGDDRPSITSGAPVIYVSTSPAELIVLKGEPQFEPIGGTNLLWAKNTTAPLLLDTGTNDYYAVISGRWFRSRSLNGPWSYAPPDKLPRDLALIPDDHPLAPVRAAVPGTPQAAEAVIANAIPQNSTIRRSEASFTPNTDGAPQLRPIAGTPLQYVANSATPIIRVDENSWYAVDQGVWFTAQSVNGPWEAATWVPPVIYTIPADSPLHYVTYVKVYGATPDDIYTGYTPGYLGAVTDTSGTVVVGTGVMASPWIGNAWFGAPWTYGFGWSVGVGPFWPTWSPWAAPWWGPAWAGWWRPPFWGWGWGWGPAPGWGWVRPPFWAWGGRPWWGPTWGWARPPVFFPPPIARPGFVPPGVRPGFPPVAVPRFPTTAGAAFGPRSNLIANQSVPRGPGWSTGAPAVSALPQGFQRSVGANPNLFSAAPAAGAAAASAASAARGVGVPTVPGGWQTFRGTQPNANAFSGSTYRAPAQALNSISGGGISTPRPGVYAPPAAGPAQPQAYIRGNPLPGGNQFGTVPRGAVPQPSIGYNPGMNPGVGALPRYNGGMAAPSFPGMPRGGGMGVPGAGVSGFQGAPAAGRGPGWGGGGARGGGGHR